MSLTINPHKIDFLKLKIVGTLAVTLFVSTVLIWEYFHEGILSHHLLHQEELPAISNAWSALLLPLMTWVLLSRVSIRLKSKNADASSVRNSLLLFLAAVFFGACLAGSFTFNFEPFLNNVLVILILLSLLIPNFYAEFILGFVLAMTITFGAVLPTLFMLVFAVIGFICYRYIRSIFVRLWKLIVNKQ